MKNLPLCAAAAAALTAVSGCKTEAERFGYKGEDLVDQEAKTFVVTAPAVTNWVPERVLSVSEKYEFTADEKSLVDTVGVMMPGASYEAIPEPYAKDSEEPWFVWWARKGEAFGLKDGKMGLLSHFNDDKNVWETNESYFSTYWKTRDEARAALAAIRAELALKHGVKMFHEIDNGWIAEYVRLIVMGVVGQKPDGTWSCMLDFRDKCAMGCGPWEPLEEQRERRNQSDYAKAMRAWRAGLAAALERNKELVAQAAQEKGLAGLPGASVAGTAENGMSVFVVGGAGEPQTTDEGMDAAFAAMWAARVEALAKGLGVTPAQDGPSKQEIPDEGTYWSQLFQGPLYQARLDAVKPIVRALPPADEAGQEGETPEQPAFTPQWRILFSEMIQPGVTLPQKPQLKK